jgi:hypothetical protein
MGRASGKALKRPVSHWTASIYLRRIQEEPSTLSAGLSRQQGACKKLHILQKLSFLTSQTKGLCGAGWQTEMGLGRARATSPVLPRVF